MSKRTIWITTSILLIYFIFTSGSAYEAMGSNITNRLVAPYSFALSGERTGLVGIFTKDDVKCAEWLNNTGDSKLSIVGDRNTVTLLKGFYNISLHRAFIPMEDSPVIGHYYIFVRAWNISQQKTIVTINRSEGIRETKDWMPLDMTYCHEVFRSGGSIIYEYQND